MKTAWKWKNLDGGGGDGGIGEEKDIHDIISIICASLSSETSQFEPWLTLLH